jgi:SAM-dependent methyltransferase
VEEQVYRVMYEAEERHWWFRGRRAVIDAMLNRIDVPQPAMVLDAGCGTGRNLELLARFGEAHGVDPAPQAVDFCRQRALPNVQRGTAEALPFEDGKFGLIAATDVVEHVANDDAALRELHRVAAPGAALLLTVPAYPWLWSSEDERLEHYRRYTLRSLCRAARSASWEPVFGTYFNFFLLAPIALARRLPRRGPAGPELERTPAWANGPLSIPMRLESRLIRLGLSLPAGVSVGLVCRRA